VAVTIGLEVTVPVHTDAHVVALDLGAAHAARMAALLDELRARERRAALDAREALAVVVHVQSLDARLAHPLGAPTLGAAVREVLLPAGEAVDDTTLLHVARPGPRQRDGTAAAGEAGLRC
jgi:hypothetical protein